MWPVGSFLTKGYNIFVKALYKPSERRWKKYLSILGASHIGRVAQQVISRGIVSIASMEKADLMSRKFQ